MQMSHCKITNLELLDMALDVLNVFVSATSVQNNIEVFTIYLAHLQEHKMLRWCTGMHRQGFLWWIDVDAMQTSVDHLQVVMTTCACTALQTCSVQVFGCCNTAYVTWCNAILTTHLCDDAVINNATFVIGEHTQSACTVFKTCNITNNQWFQELYSILALHGVSHLDLHPDRVDLGIAQQVAKQPFYVLCRWHFCIWVPPHCFVHSHAEAHSHPKASPAHMCNVEQGSVLSAEDAGVHYAFFVLNGHWPASKRHHFSCARRLAE